MPLAPSRVQRIPPQALYFDGVDDYVQVPYIGVFNQQPFTVIGIMMQMVLKVDEPLLSTGDSQSVDRYLHLVIRNGNPYMGFWSDDLQASYYVGTGVWVSLAFVWEGPATKVRTIYVNGTLVASNTSNGLLTVTSGSLTGNGIWIGKYSSYSTRIHSGYIAQVLVYSRALSQDEIRWNYNYPDNPVRNGLVLWLHWDSIDVSAGKWYDKSGYGNHGTIYGATLAQIVKPARRVLTPSRVLAPVR